MALTPEQRIARVKAELGETLYNAIQQVVADKEAVAASQQIETMNHDGAGSVHLIMVKDGRVAQQLVAFAVAAASLTSSSPVRSEGQPE